MFFFSLSQPLKPRVLFASPTSICLGYFVEHAKISEKLCQSYGHYCWGFFIFFFWGKGVMMVREERQIFSCYHYWYNALYSRLPNVQSRLLFCDPRLICLASYTSQAEEKKKTVLQRTAEVLQCWIVRRHSLPQLPSGNWREHKRMFYFPPISQELLYFYLL